MSFSSPTSVVIAWAVLRTFWLVSSWASRSSAHSLSLRPGSVFPPRPHRPDQERGFPLLPVVAPVLDHGREQRAVLVGPAGVRLALVPDDALDGEGDQGRDHAVVQVGALEPLQPGRVVQDLLARPALGRGAAPRAVDQA